MSLDQTIPQMTGRINRRFGSSVTALRVWRRVIEQSLGHQVGRQWFIPLANEDTLAQALGLLAPKSGE